MEIVGRFEEMCLILRFDSYAWTQSWVKQRASEYIRLIVNKIKNENAGILANRRELVAAFIAAAPNNMVSSINNWKGNLE